MRAVCRPTAVVSIDRCRPQGRLLASSSASCPLPAAATARAGSPVRPVYGLRPGQNSYRSVFRGPRCMRGSAAVGCPPPLLPPPPPPGPHRCCLPDAGTRQHQRLYQSPQQSRLWKPPSHAHPLEAYRMAAASDGWMDVTFVGPPPRGDEGPSFVIFGGLGWLLGSSLWFNVFDVFFCICCLFLWCAV